MSDIPKSIQLLNYKLVNQRIHQALDLFAISSNAMRDNMHRATEEEAEALNQEMRDMLRQCAKSFEGRPEYLVYLVLISLVVDTVEITLQGQKSLNQEMRDILAQKNDLVN